MVFVGYLRNPIMLHIGTAPFLTRVVAWTIVCPIHDVLHEYPLGVLALMASSCSSSFVHRLVMPRYAASPLWNLTMRTWSMMSWAPGVLMLAAIGAATVGAIEKPVTQWT